MGISVDTDTIKDKSLSVAKDVGAAALSVGAGAATYGVAQILSGSVSNKFAKQAVEYVQMNNTKLFKNAAEQAFKHENIFCTTPDKALEAFMNMTRDHSIKEQKQLNAFAAMFDSGNNYADKINNKINIALDKIISPVTKIIKKRGGLVEQTKEGLNSMTKKDFVFCDLEKMAMTSFHEMGHVKNYRSKFLGKLLRGMKHPLVKKIAIATALLGVLLPPSKKEDEQNSSVLGKTGKFLKDNCVAISALATVPGLLEEGLASIKGAQIAKKVLTPDKVKMVNKLNGKAFVTYLIGATLLPLGVYAAKKVRDALA